MTNQLKIVICRGAPSSGKSTWAKAEVAKDPLSWLRLNNDDLRATFNGSVWSADYEKIIRAARNFLTIEGLRQGKNLILDNVNADHKTFQETIKLIQKAGIDADIEVSERCFYLPLEEALARNALREGTARVPDEAVTRFFKKLGGKHLQHYVPRIEVVKKRDYCLDAAFTPAQQNQDASPAIISDLDGTLALMGQRSPYIATNCDLIDAPNPPVVETIKLYYVNGHQIIFCSGREDKYEPETRRFIEKHLPGMNYHLWMRKSQDKRKDAVIKEEIYREHIEGKFWVKFVLDDRNQVVSLWRSLGLVCFQVAPGDF